MSNSRSLTLQATLVASIWSIWVAFDNLNTFPETVKNNSYSIHVPAQRDITAKDS